MLHLAVTAVQFAAVWLCACWNVCGVEATKMYWIDANTDKIQRSNLDGSSVEDLVTTGLSYPDSIALDVAAGERRALRI